MKLNRLHIFISLLSLSLASCDYTTVGVETLFENKYSPWNGSYESIINTKQSYVLLHYDSTFEYLLTYKNGNVIQENGNYKYKNNRIYLSNDNWDNVLLEYSYYRFSEIIVYEDVEYTIIWHASKIS